MRQKELRIALVCYGGVSLAVYMHGVTKELWHLAQASRAFHSGAAPKVGSRGVYRRLLEQIQSKCDLRLRVLPDILTGASAGGINAVFLAQAVHSGYSLDPLTELWLDAADVDELTDPDARPMWRFAKLYAQPFAEYLLRRPGNVVSESVAPETRAEVRQKVSSLVRGRWFEPPFSGPGFSRLLHRAFMAMEEGGASQVLLPPGHPVDLFVTATDFRGHSSLLRLNSPSVVLESEHRMPIGFRSPAPAKPGQGIADPRELVFAARATASFPGAFPPMTIAEIDALNGWWDGREAFVQRIMPAHAAAGNVENVALIDGSVLVNKPFEGAIAALKGRPARREVDRRFVYVDPRPDRFGSRSATAADPDRPIGFFSAIFGSLSTLPREQPIRDNLEVLEQQSREALRLRRTVAKLRPEVEGAVEKLFGRTLFFDKPTPKRLANWRQKSQAAAAAQAGFAFQSYAQTKLAGTVRSLAALVHRAVPELGLPDTLAIEAALMEELERRGLATLSNGGNGLHEDAIAFFRSHDIAFRVRRLRLLERRLARDWDADPELDDDAVERARDAIYRILALYFDREGLRAMGEGFDDAARRVLEAPGEVLDYLAAHRLLPDVDARAEQMLAEALQDMPGNLKRRILLTYLGFPYYDVATLSLLKNEGLTEFDPVKVDRISPEDARTLREGGTAATLRGIEFFNFGAFFSRAYRENDYLWGRLHGGERMIDLVASTLDHTLPDDVLLGVKRDLFLAILDEEADAGLCAGGRISSLRDEVLAKLG